MTHADAILTAAGAGERLAELHGHPTPGWEAPVPSASGNASPPTPPTRSRPGSPTR